MIFRRTNFKRFVSFPLFKLLIIALFLTMLSAAIMASEVVDKDDSFSFIVFGDSRIPAYIPFDQNNKDELDELMHAVTKYAYAGGKVPYKAVFNPQTLQLERIELPGKSKGQKRIITYGDDGWPEVFVDKQGEFARVGHLSIGQEWVYDNIVREINENVSEQKDGPTFSLHTGDIVYFGYQGKGADESPYWRHFNRNFLSSLPEGGPGDLTARFFPVLGNHETWGDKDIIGFREMFPYLKELGFSEDHRVYCFDYKNSRFMFLDSGIMNPEDPADWYKSTPGYEKQLDYLSTWIEDAIAMGKEHAFITFHYPVFCRSGYGALPEKHNPHSLLKKYADKIDITVFNEHVHATEAYKVDGIRYLVLGGGGGEQTLNANEMPGSYPKDYYWKGEPRQLDYNYVVVNVNGKNIEITVNRFRPNELKPYSQINIVPELID
ncbi:MAG: metallophosphoesterase family protein [Kosmotogaceae bacterium]